ncbi:MAG TPA: hypothetical protein VFN85_07500 [Solirubrobacterales bacterium]|nr:hypothetical protein [Solirubrobacterales bacterium]
MKGAKAAVLAILVLGAACAMVPAAIAVGDGAGAQVSGTVTQVGTGKPLQNVKVCVEAVAPENGELCDLTDVEGNYAIAGIPAATYLVAFGVDSLPGGARTAAQWWDGASSPGQATPITLAPPQIFTGINGQIGSSGVGSKAHTGGGTIVVPGPQPTPPPELVPQHCKKGYRWRKIDGVKRCVPKPHHHRRHHA